DYLPQRQTEGSAGYDLRAADSYTLYPGHRLLVPTGLGLKLPGRNYYAQIASRSSLAMRFGIVAQAGVIDSDYRGELNVLLFNFGAERFDIAKGDRIAQLVVHHICIDPPKWGSADKTTRGAGGFGSTGVS